MGEQGEREREEGMGRFKEGGPEGAIERRGQCPQGRREGTADEGGAESWGESQDPKQPTSNRAMFLPSYSFPFSVSVLLMKGLLSLGLPSPEKAEE